MWEVGGGGGEVEGVDRLGSGTWWWALHLYPCFPDHKNGNNDNSESGDARESLTQKKLIRSGWRGVYSHKWVRVHNNKLKKYLKLEQKVCILGKAISHDQIYESDSTVVIYGALVNI